MLTIIQSQRTEQLFKHLLAGVSQPTDNIFTPYTVIVPSLVVGDWLEQRLAEHIGISSLINTLFWGKFQWQLLKTVLDARNSLLPTHQQVQVPDVAPLSVDVMQWQIFAFLLAKQNNVLTDANHPLFPLLAQLVKQVRKNHSTPVATQQHAHQTQQHHPTHTTEIDEQIRQRLWQLAAQFARVFARYISHRPNWLIMWQQGEPLPIEQMLANKDHMAARFNANAPPTPNWLKNHYQELHNAQMWLWQQLFAHSFSYRSTIEETFWQAMQQGYAKQSLPKKLTIFTVQQLPEAELNFIKHLSLYIDIVFLHYNPSQLFWADIVDKDWLIRQRLINPQQVYLRDYGHSLLSRMGKQSREVFALLADMAGNELGNTAIQTNRDPANGHNQTTHYSNHPVQFQVSWHDDFVDAATHSLLSQLQYDILMLEENNSQQQANNLAATTWQQLYQQFYQQQSHKHYQPERHWQLDFTDNSLRIHSCHSLQRQLEVLRSEIIRWLNQNDNNDAPKKQLADILILLPNVDAHKEVIQAVFPDGIGADGYHLPARLTGVAPPSVSHLWQAITNFYELSHQRFDAQSVFDWLMLPELHQTYGLSYEQMQRGCDLLVQAGFIRGLNETHLQHSLHPQDTDTRFCFSDALDRLVTGLLMPQAPYFSYRNTLVNETHYIVPMPDVQLADAAIVSALCELYADICKIQPLYLQQNTAYFWLENIELLIHQRFASFNQTTALSAIWLAINSFKKSLRAMRLAQQHTASQTDLTPQQLPLAFILTSIGGELASQQTSSEPAGVITIGRFGTLRPLPYRVIAMVNMNMGDFPNHEQDNRYDLIQADVPKRGDRFKEDDDLGAFLDALLCARDACWLFFNGASLTDTHEHLPANPVQELLTFLTDEVTWQASKQLQVNDLSNRQLVYHWLVTEHPALPFHPDNFVVNSDTVTSKQLLHNVMRTPPARIWQQLYMAMQQPKHNTPFVSLPNTTELNQLLQPTYLDKVITTPLALDAHRWIQDLQQPARHYLLSQHINPLKTQEDLITLEPLALSPLTAYQLRHALLTEYKPHTANAAHAPTPLNTRLAINHLLPAGVSKNLSLQQQQQQLSFNLNQLFNHATIYTTQHNITLADSGAAQHLTKVSENAVKIGKITVKCQLPAVLKTPLWLNVLPHKAKAKYVLSFWLQHLLWQVARQTSTQDVVSQQGTSIWQFNKTNNTQGICIFPPITQQHAQSYLQLWLNIWHFNQQQPLVLPVTHAFNFAKNFVENNKKPDNITLISGFNDWLMPNFNANYVDESCAQHETWQLILAGQDPTFAITPAIYSLAVPLYEPLLTHLTQL